MKQAVIFDFDGTIADSFEYVLGFLQSEAGDIRKLSKAEKDAYRQMSMKRIALRLGIPLWRLPVLYFRGRRVMRDHMEHVRLFPGMDQVVRDLSGQGYLLFIVSSNSAHNIRRFLRRYDLSQHFVAVRGGAGIGGKVNIIRQLMLRHRLLKRHTWYVGDEVGDIISATRVGIGCVAVGWGFADPGKLRLLEPTAFADRPADVAAALKALWKK